MDKNLEVEVSTEQLNRTCSVCVQPLDSLRTKHEQVHIQYGENDAFVDKNIAPLILECWRAGINTTLSCQDNVPSGWIWIEFLTAYDAERFLSIAAGAYNNDLTGLYNRAVHGWDSRSGIQIDFWKYSVSLSDLSVDAHETDDGYIEEHQNSETDINLYMSVRFPSYDIQQVLYNLCQSSASNHQTD